jgi:hypothetical protein
MTERDLRVLFHKILPEELGGLGEKMKLQLMFLLMDIFMLLACGYLWRFARTPADVDQRG